MYASQPELLLPRLQVLVSFSATWCGPCKFIEPTLKKIKAEGMIDVVTVKMETDQKIDSIRRWLASKGEKVSALPTCVLLDRGEIKGALVGRFAPSKLAAML